MTSSRSAARPRLLLVLLCVLMMTGGVVGTAVTRRHETPPHSTRAGLCGPMGGTSEVEASKAAALDASPSSSDDEDLLLNKASTYWVDPSQVPSCRKDIEQFETEFVSHKHLGTAVSLWTFKHEHDRPSSSDQFSGGDSSASSVAAGTHQSQRHSSSSSSEAAAALQILAVPVAIVGPFDDAAGAVRGLLQAGEDITRALLYFINRFLDSSAAKNAWPRERVTAVGLTRGSAANPSLLSFTVLYTGEVGDVRTLTAQSVALVGDSTFDAQVVGAPFTTAAVGPDTLTYDSNDLEQLRLNLAIPAGLQVVVPDDAASNRPAAPPPIGDNGGDTPNTPASTPSASTTPATGTATTTPAGATTTTTFTTPGATSTTMPGATTTFTTPGATTTTTTVVTTPGATTSTPGATTFTTPSATTTYVTTPGATTTAGCDPNACKVDTGAKEGWLFGAVKESCDTVCSNYNDWGCDASKLNTITSKDELASARASVLNCYFPIGYCEALPLKFNTFNVQYAPLAYKNLGGTYYYSASTTFTCAATPGLSANRL